LAYHEARRKKAAGLVESPEIAAAEELFAKSDDMVSEAVVENAEISAPNAESPAE
jgi:hypothetical protein